MVSMVVLKVDSNPNDPMIPYRVTVGVRDEVGALVVVKVDSNPNDPMIPFRVSVWCP